LTPDEPRRIAANIARSASKGQAFNHNLNGDGDGRRQQRRDSGHGHFILPSHPLAQLPFATSSSKAICWRGSDSQQATMVNARPRFRRLSPFGCRQALRCVRAVALSLMALSVAHAPMPDHTLAEYGVCAKWTTKAKPAARRAHQRARTRPHLMPRLRRAAASDLCQT
jgi:hypothetical protein